MELTRAIKLLNLTRSKNENESRAAMQKLNTAILCWETFFKNVVTREKLKARYTTKTEAKPQDATVEYDPHFIPMWQALADIATFGTSEEQQFAKDVLHTNTVKGSISAAAAERARKIHQRLSHD